MRPTRLLTSAGLVALAFTGFGVSAAHAARADDPVVAWDASSVTAEYGEYWGFSASAAQLPAPAGPYTATATGGTSGYTPIAGAYQSDFNTVLIYVNPSLGRPLPAGSYPVNFTVTGAGSGLSYSPPAPATLTITPAALATTLQVIADPSNPANAIISSDLTGAFRTNFFTASYPDGPLPPVGVWTLTVKDENGDVVHHAEVDRTENEDIMGASTYWSDVAPGTYTVTATFTATGATAGNFEITAPAPVTYTAAPAPGATSTATPAPPAPPPTPGDTGMTLPLWVPFAAGVLSLGLITLMIVQIVRLRRAGMPAAASEVHGAGA